MFSRYNNEVHTVISENYSFIDQNFFLVFIFSSSVLYFLLKINIGSQESFNNYHINPFFHEFFINFLTCSIFFPVVNHFLVSVSTIENETPTLTFLY